MFAKLLLSIILLAQALPPGMPIYNPDGTLHGAPTPSPGPVKDFVKNNFLPLNKFIIYFSSVYESACRKHAGIAFRNGIPEVDFNVKEWQAFPAIVHCNDGSKYQIEGIQNANNI